MMNEDLVLMTEQLGLLIKTRGKGELSAASLSPP